MELHAENCSLEFCEEHTRKFFRRVNEKRKAVSGCQPSALLEAFVKMIGSEILMMAILKPEN